jgi:hypothetical protein
MRVLQAVLLVLHSQLSSGVSAELVYLLVTVVCKLFQSVQNWLLNHI